MKKIILLFALIAVLFIPLVGCQLDFNPKQNWEYSPKKPKFTFYDEMFDENKVKNAAPELQNFLSDPDNEDIKEWTVTTTQLNKLKELFENDINPISVYSKNDEEVYLRDMIKNFTEKDDKAKIGNAVEKVWHGTPPEGYHYIICYTPIYKHRYIFYK